MNFSIYQASHIGNRKYNQDRVAYAYSDDALLLVLADGMGGHLHGELAASMAIETFVESFGQQASQTLADPQLFLGRTMRHAHERIMKISHDRALGAFPGTTCVAALIQDGIMYSGHAGDSRLYLLRDGKVLHRTKDHSVVHQWLELGIISADEARTHPQRNQITNCLGGVEDMFYMEPGEPVVLRSGDVVLLGSDGLWGPFTDVELTETFAAMPLADALNNLIERALQREGGRSDNVTGIAVRWGDGEPAHNTAEPVCEILEIA
ncbi:MAG TPA: protein phosphatase 2C domain-containing protein [Gallionella sp.]|nr:protein phosphatase 2C domain-containing protein [Gallionella sp.]